MVIVTEMAEIAEEAEEVVSEEEEVSTKTIKVARCLTCLLVEEDDVELPHEHFDRVILKHDIF